MMDPESFTPKKRPRKNKPTVHEDIVDGFSFLAYKNYDDLERGLRQGEDRRICVQVVKNGKTNSSVSVSTNTSPLAPKNKAKSKPPPLRRSGPVMDQENGAGGESSSLIKKKKHKRKAEDGGTQTTLPQTPSAVSNGKGDVPSPVTVAESSPSPPAPIASTASPPEQVVPIKAEDAGVADGKPSTSASSTNPTNGHHPPPPPIQQPHKVSSFFTPYATNTITRLDCNGVPTDNGGSSEPPRTTAAATTTSNSKVFGSIARLLDSPTTSSASSTSPHHRSAHSPRGHSPSRERDSYSSNVSSLSRGSVTPSNHNPPPPANLSPSLSYAKAANWLNTVPVPAVPRPTPPPQSPLMQQPLQSPYQQPPPPMFPPPPLMTHEQMLHHGSMSTYRDSLLSLHQNQMGTSFYSPMSHLSSALRPPPLPNPPRMDATSAFFRGLGGMYPSFAPPPAQLPPITPKKTGRWNALHVRIAWEIYHRQNKGDTRKLSNLFKSTPSAPPPPPPDIFRPPLYPPRPLDFLSTSRPPLDYLGASSANAASSGGFPRFPGPYPPTLSLQHDPWSRMGNVNGSWSTLMSEPKRPVSPFRDRSPLRVNGDSGRAAEDKSHSQSPHSSRMLLGPYPPPPQPSTAMESPGYSPLTNPCLRWPSSQSLQPPP